VTIVTGKSLVFIVDGKPNYVPAVGPCGGADQIAFSLTAAAAKAAAIGRDSVARVTAWPRERFTGQGVGEAE
jgi:hypothetical protein